jgi:phosphoglycerol transferase MdoB-like AlkP superfamily enzyme
MNEVQRRPSAIVVLFLRLGSVVILYSLLRIAFWLYNKGIFQDPPLSSFLGGIRFDLSAIAWTNLPWVLLYLIQPRPTGPLRWLQFGLFMLVNAVALFFQCIDLGYYAFTMKRTTADFLGFLFAGGDTVNLAPAFLRDHWHILLIYLSGLLFIGWCYLRADRWVASIPTSRLKEILWRIAAIGLLFLASRGGFQLIPLQVLDAAKYGGATHLPLVLNTPFTMMMTLGKPTLQERNYMAQEDADRLWPVIHKYNKGNSSSPNICIIILESFSAVYSGRLSGQPGHMPFLDSLMQHGLNFTRAYANGRRSIDGVPAILASLPELMNEAFITSPYASTPFTSIASELKKNGYRSSFYHGGRNGTMGFDGFTRSAGFDRYSGLNEYPNADRDHDGHWGIRDRPFLQYWADELSKEEEPFLSCVFTLSSHHPYELPADEAERFNGGSQKIHATLRYTDDALRQFFATARRRPWFENTIFVITSDHTADIDRNGQSYDSAVDYWIPLVYYSPKWIEPKEMNEVTQQIDILPTLLDLAGHEQEFFSFGHSALHQARPYAINSSNAIYNAIGEELHIQFDGEQIITINPLDQGSAIDPAGAAEIELHLKAAIQQYHHHVGGGKLTVSAAP